MNWPIRAYYVKNLTYESFIVTELLISFWLGSGFYFSTGIATLNKSGLTGILSNFCSNHLPSLQHRYLQKTQLAVPLAHALHYNAPSTAVLKGVILPSLTSQMKKNLQPYHII